MIRASTSIIPFDRGRSFVVQDLPVRKSGEHPTDDHLERTKNDQEFLERFERIFLAAAKGDLAECQAVVDLEFCDFNAISVGKFCTESGISLDRVSPIAIAARHGHVSIIKLFQQYYRPPCDIDFTEIISHAEDNHGKKENIIDKTINEAISSDDTWKRDNELQRKAKTLTEGDYFDSCKAIETAKKINDENLRNCSLYESSIILTKTVLIDLAIETVNEINNDDLKNCSLHEISKILTKKGLIDEALEAATRINDDDLKNCSLHEISNISTNMGLIDEALEAADMISGDDS